MVRIHEAVERAMKENKEIFRKSAKYNCSDLYATIKPTNSYDACLIIVNKGNRRKSGRNWNPTADDLMANDWEVTTE